ncbi:MAG TPA: oligosaccharide flippase family protein [Edaphobacter sp.]|nr:oligosaccharide flippase family protein [Edaphobacter sp.]
MPGAVILFETSRNEVEKQAAVSRIGEIRRRGYTNAIYGIADYLTLPIGMLLAAPLLLRHLGVAQYGVWLLASAAVSGGGIVSGSFGDAAIKYVGECRSREDWSGVTRIVRNMMSINLTLSGILALILWCLAPYLTHHIAKADPGLKAICMMSLRIGSGLLLIKSIESVFISTLRGFEIYGVTVRIAMIFRCAILMSAVVLASEGHDVVSIMFASLVLSIIGMVAQGAALRNKIGTFSPIPTWDRKTVSDIATFGTLSWLQAVASVVFSQADRFFVAFFLGAPAVAYYGLCVQAAQPVHGLVSSGMHFLFPHLSARYPVAPGSEIKRKVVLAVRLNILMVSILSLPVILFGKHILRIWIGSAFDQQPQFIFPIIVLSFAFLGLNITAHYALLAAGQVRIVTGLNLLAGVTMLLLMALSIPGHGLEGAALSRLIYGPITCLAYIRLRDVVWSPDTPKPLSQPALYEVANQ